MLVWYFDRLTEAARHEIYAAYQENDWKTIIQLYIEYKVSPIDICEGCQLAEIVNRTKTAIEKGIIHGAEA